MATPNSRECAINSNRAADFKDTAGDASEIRASPTPTGDRINPPGSRIQNAGRTDIETDFLDRGNTCPRRFAQCSVVLEERTKAATEVGPFDIAITLKRAFGCVLQHRFE